MGYSNEEIQASLQRKLVSVQQQPQQPQEGLLSRIATGLLKPFATTGNTLAGGAFELGRLPLAKLASTKIGGKLISPETRNKLLTAKNPFVDLEKIDKEGGKFIGDQARASLQLASYGVPIGGTTSLFGKAIGAGALKGGVIAGGMYGAGEEGATPGSVTTSALTGGVTAGLLSKLLKTPSTLQRTGTAGRQAVRGIRQGGAEGALKETALSNELSGLGLKGSAKAQRVQAGLLKRDLNTQLDDLLKAKNPVVEGKDVLSQIRKGVLGDTNNNFIPGDKTYEKAYERVMSGLTKQSSGKVYMDQLLRFKTNLQDTLSPVYKKIQVGNPLNPMETTQLAIRNKLDDLITLALPESKPILTQMSILEKTAPFLQKSAGGSLGTGGLYGTVISLARRPVQATTDTVSRGMIGAGRLASPIEAVSGVAPAIGSRAATAALPKQNPNDQKVQILNAIKSLGATGQQMPIGQMPTGQATVPQQQAALPGAPTKEQFQQAMLADLAQGGKNLAKIKSVMDVLYPEEKASDKTEAQIARESIAGLVGDALQQFSTGTVKTGPFGIESRLEGAKSIFGKGDQPTLNFRATIASLKAAIAKARAGTSFTPNEERLLNQYTPNTGDSEQQVMTKLMVLQSMQNIFSQ